MMHPLNPRKWYFTIYFDEEKCKRNHYDPQTLYDYIEKCADVLEIERVDNATWQPIPSAHVQTMCSTMSALVDQEWFINNVEKVIYHEGGDQGHNLIDDLKKISSTPTAWKLLII
ncbi:hypothetical protein HF861_04310 [Faecalicoccus pleomorphus]|uniref:Uncharacterized protein n=1 Tax=Faecalicoccus pleomorphus TaxID=1323 RepID=A0A7X9NH62_9FIRM|nr:hypothetical protein [Faecalicoccus pleomorphus]NME44105.1 hypothetical protein [Faecalicoccus pleomorphus]